MKPGPIIERLLKKDVIEPANPKFWAAQTKVLNRLKKDYNDESFWQFFNLDFKLNHLAFFLTPKGKELLEQKYNFYLDNLPSKKEEEKTGEKLEVIYNKEKVERPKSLLDFI